MNHILKAYAKHWINEHLPMLHSANVELFHKCYGRLNGKRSVEDAVLMKSSDVIDEMDDDQLNHAMVQIESTMVDYSRQKDRLGERGIHFQEADGQWMFYSCDGDGDGLYYPSLYQAIYEANEFYPLS